jgi:DNA sulfur modification protein DndE
MDIFTDLQNKTNLKPFALAKLAIALSLKKDYKTLIFNTDTNGLDLNKQTITGKYDVMYRCLIELAEEYKYAKDFISHLANLEEAL